MPPVPTSRSPGEGGPPAFVSWLPDVVAQSPDLLGRRRIGLEERLTQSKRTERQAHDAGPAGALESVSLQTAATEIEEQAVRNREAADRSGETEAASRRPSDNVDPNPELAMQPLEEGAVRASRIAAVATETMRLVPGAGRNRMKVP